MLQPQCSRKEVTFQIIQYVIIFTFSKTVLTLEKILYFCNFLQLVLDMNIFTEVISKFNESFLDTSPFQVM